MVSDRGRTERCYIQIRVDDGMRREREREREGGGRKGSRVGSLSSQICVCVRCAGTHGGLRRIVFKTAGGSQALEPSCDLVLPQRPGPIASPAGISIHSYI